MMNLFETATRYNDRFESEKGMLNVSDLWQLPLMSKRGPSLQGVAMTVNRELQEIGGETFVRTDKVDPRLEALKRKLNVVRRVIEVKEDEARHARLKEARKQEKETLLEILEKKQSEALGELTPEELMARIKRLED
jgi:hypothetical protein